MSLSRQPAVRLRSPRRGSVIVLVLVLVLLTAMLLNRFIESTSVGLLLETRYADREHLRQDARAALEVTLATLADFIAVDHGLYTPAQGWSDPLAYAGYTPRPGVTIAISFEDESGKIPLPNASRDTLFALFEHLGLADAEANKVTDALFFWIQDGYVPTNAEVDDSVYAAAVTPYQPAHRSLRSFDELRSVLVARDFFFDADDQPKPLFKEFSDSVSLYSFSTSNVNAALSSTLAASLLDDSQAKTIADYVSGTGSRLAGAPPYLRSGKDYRDVMGSAPNNGLGTTIKCLRIKIVVTEGAANLTLTALVAQPGQAALPPVATVGDTTSAQNQVGTANTTSTDTAAAGQSQATGSTTRTQSSSPLNYPFVILELNEESSMLPPPSNASL